MTKANKIQTLYRPRLTKENEKRLRHVSIESGEEIEALVNRIVESELPKLEKKYLKSK